MYRNSQDKRVLNSANLLYEAIVELLEVKSFDKIGISEISEKAGIGRATFYRNFDYVGDVLRLKLDQCFKVLIQRVAQSHSAEDLPIDEFFIFWGEQYEILEVLKKAKCWEIFNERFRLVSHDRLMLIKEKYDLSPTEHAYLLTNAQAMYSAILFTWLDRGRIEQATQLRQLSMLPLDVYVKSMLKSKNNKQPIK